MLYLKRNIGESIIIGDNIRISVVEIKGKNVKLGFEYPSNISVLRQEIHDKIQSENRLAATSGEGLLAALKKPLDLNNDEPK